MINELEHLAAAHCIKLSTDSKSLLSALMGNNRAKLSDHQIQEKVLTLSSYVEQIQRWLTAMQNNTCNCSNNL